MKGLGRGPGGGYVRHKIEMQETGNGVVLRSSTCADFVVNRDTEALTGPPSRLSAHM